jgi:hypothetical protein
MHNELFLCVEVCFSIPNKICCLLNELFDSSINRDLYFLQRFDGKVFNIELYCGCTCLISYHKVVL